MTSTAKTQETPSESLFPVPAEWKKRAYITEERYRQIIEYTIAQGIIPVLITKADDLESLENTAPVGYINTTIRALALEYDVPLLDLRLAVEGLPNHGCNADGFHYNTPPDAEDLDSIIVPNLELARLAPAVFARSCDVDSPFLRPLDRELIRKNCRGR